MICYIKVPQARFHAKAITSREMIYENNIYPQSQILTFEVFAGLEFRNYSLTSSREAVPVMEKTIEALYERLVMKLRDEFARRGFTVNSVTAVDIHNWDITLSESTDSRPTASVGIESDPVIARLL